MSGKFQAPRGTFDILPAGSMPAGARLRRRRQLFARAGYGRIETPDLRGHRAVRARGRPQHRHRARRRCSRSRDQGGRSLTLRPEGTAPIAAPTSSTACRRSRQPVKLWHWGPYFRRERPQAGRYRQFNQIGLEAIGSDSPLVDAEMVILLDELLRELGVPGVRLRPRKPRLAGLAQRYREELPPTCARRVGDLAADVRRADRR